MADEFRQQQQFQQQPPDEPKKRGCLFYGCLGAIVLLLLMLVLIGSCGYMGYRSYMNIVQSYTDTAPQPLPMNNSTPEQQQAVDARVQAFDQKVTAGEPTQPLVLTADDLNAIVASKPELRDRVFLTIDDDKIKGEVSIPLDKMNLPAFLGLKGRYLNGKGAFKIALANGQLYVTLDSLEVRGEQVPESAMAQLRVKNLAEEYNKDPKNREALSKYDSLTVDDGKVTITASPKNAPPADAAAEAEPVKPEDAAQPVGQ